MSKILKIFSIAIALALNFHGFAQNLQVGQVKNLPNRTVTSTVSQTAKVPILYNNTVSKVTASQLFGYKQYVALITQASTDAPTVTVLHNGLGGTIVWTRTSVGTYQGKLLSTFTANKTIGFGGGTPLGNLQKQVSLLRGTDSTVVLRTDSLLDARLTATPIEIRVYNFP